MKVPVREVSSKGSSTLVEWADESGNVYRSNIPSTEIRHEGGKSFVENPAEGAPYGEIWEELIRAKSGPKGIADLLRKNGIWNYEDFRNNTPIVNSVFREACAINYQAFVDAVHSRQNTVIQEGKE